ncbi:SDR family NAD(P)-dependent oxidoreductase [Glycomyces terrestris]|uniref:SDR family NAD(P)-dependent oxidoreductase n=1 Tax=Glycomyces terrestris TaxID=2493553 RepID=A0A426V3D8_9ACTN|nr:SDR family NAD(P)-dependent oxidoreductase [Glycomyces terrestris]RRS01365.1 SDR family NAD(P)-dependent oxidoreductase [Glycomyces terrestris]
MPVQEPNTHRPRVIVVSGGTDGMGRALTLARAERGDQVVALGSNPAKGRQLVAEAERIGAADRVRFLQADLSSVEATRRAVREITGRHEAVDALCLFANRQSPKRATTSEGLERTFALYYLSRYLLGHELTPLLRRSSAPVIVNVAGVGVTKGAVHWDDLQLERKYHLVTAQLQAGRANDLLGVAYASQADNPVRYVLYHPGFTKSGDLSPLPAAARLAIRVLGAFAARPVEQSIAPLHGLIDNPPSVPLTAIDRGTSLPLTLRTLDPANAQRLAKATEKLLDALPTAPA